MKLMPRLEADDDPTRSLISAQDNVNVPGRVEPGEAVGLREHAHVRQLAVREALQDHALAAAISLTSSAANLDGNYDLYVPGKDVG